MNPQHAIVFTATETAEFQKIDDPGPLGPREVRGPTVCTLVSPGTELNWGYLGGQFPRVMGYASVFRVAEAGTDVKTLSELMGHASATITLDLYVHSNLEQKRKAANRLPDLVEGGRKLQTGVDGEAATASDSVN